jgi:hypothetical protein
MSLHNAGDAPLLVYTLKDPTTGGLADATVTVTVTAPDGTNQTPGPVLHPSLGIYQFAPPPLLADLTRATRVTFTGTSSTWTDTETYYLFAVDPASTAGLIPPPWAPALEDVAVHIPSRTREVGILDAYRGTFTQDTTPTSDQVALLIEHACVWVMAEAGQPVVPAAYPACTVAAALWTAYWVELGYPERDADVAVYDRLLPAAQAMTGSAARVNVAAGGGATLDPTPEDARPLVVYAFPDPPKWADVTFL